MWKACIFDLDGTLLDTVESLAHSGNEMLKALGFSPLPVANYNYYAGEGASMLVRRCLRDSGDADLALYEKAEPLYREIFARDPYYHLGHFPGMPETLAALKERGVRLSVLSNKPHNQAIEVVERMFGGDLFDEILGQQAGMARKPAPDGALRLARLLGAKPEECLYVGDTWTDMETGHRAGMYTVGVTWGFRPEEELRKYQADRIIHGPLELLEIWEERADD